MVRNQREMEKLNRKNRCTKFSSNIIHSFEEVNGYIRTKFQIINSEKYTKDCNIILICIPNNNRWLKWSSTSSMLLLLLLSSFVYFSTLLSIESPECRYTLRHVYFFLLLLFEYSHAKLNFVPIRQFVMLTIASVPKAEPIRTNASTIHEEEKQYKTKQYRSFALSIILVFEQFQHRKLNMFALWLRFACDILYSIILYCTWLCVGQRIWNVTMSIIVTIQFLDRPASTSTNIHTHIHTLNGAIFFYASILCSFFCSFTPL